MNPITHIDLSGWIIEDGSYPDVREGEDFQCAIGIHGSEYRILSAGQPRLEHIARCEYDVCAPIVLRRKDTVVIDLGFLACNAWDKVPECVEGYWLEAALYFGVNPHLSYEERPWMPPMIYSWRILEIWRDVTPLIEEVRGSRVWVRDRSRDEWVRVSATVASEHENASYELVCERLPIPPTKETPWG